jgi:hypothetical protein
MLKSKLISENSNCTSQIPTCFIVCEDKQQMLVDAMRTEGKNANSQQKQRLQPAEEASTNLVHKLPLEVPHLLAIGVLHLDSTDTAAAAACVLYVEEAGEGTAASWLQSQKGSVLGISSVKSIGLLYVQNLRHCFCNTVPNMLLTWHHRGWQALAQTSPSACATAGARSRGYGQRSRSSYLLDGQPQPQLLLLPSLLLLVPLLLTRQAAAVLL